MISTWSSMLLTPSDPSRSMAWPMRSVRPQLSIRKPRSRWNLSVAALESRRLKELKQHSGLWRTDRVSEVRGQLGAVHWHRSAARARPFTSAVVARSRVRAAAAWPSAGRRRCPPADSCGARRERWPLSSTPSGAAATGRACGGHPSHLHHQDNQPHC